MLLFVCPNSSVGQKLRQRKKKRPAKPEVAFPTHGLNPDEVAAVANKYDTCPTCKRKFTRQNPPRVDHCHETGKVRGVICNDCNVALGWVRDNAKTLTRLQQYLEQDNPFQPDLPYKVEPRFLSAAP